MTAPLAGTRVVVAGLGVTGAAVARALVGRASAVCVVDAGSGTSEQADRATALDGLGVEVRLGPDAVEDLPSTDVDLVIASPGWPPAHPVLAGAAARGVPVWSEPELAWRLRPPTGAAPWLAVTGTNGKTTTVQMAAAIGTAAGVATTAVGNVGTPIVDAVLDPSPAELLVVELSSFQLHYTFSPAPLASCCLNLAPDHLDWHGSLAAYAADKAKVYQRTEVACVYTPDDATARMVAAAQPAPGCRAVGITTGPPGEGMLGVADGVLIDRAFGPDQLGTPLVAVSDLIDGPVPPHLVIDALAAAALTRAAGVPADAVRSGLSGFTVDAHRGSDLGVIGGVRYIDDSKATNPHAAAAALAGYDSLVWVAGGQLKGAAVDDLVTGAASRMRAAVLFGQDRDVIAAAMARHAPDVPVVTLAVSQTTTMHPDDAAPLDSFMDQVVARAAALARPGDVVLLAPAAASYDMFPGYAARGAAFARAANRLRGAD